MPEPDFSAAKEYAFGRLFSELATDLHYHCVEHTLGGVLPTSVRLARMSGLSEGDTRLLEVAAAYHDLGFIFRHEGHELASARIAAQTLPDYGFSNEQIERIMGMIMATRLPQSPRDLAEEILADADLDVLGREDYFERSELLRKEMAVYGQHYSSEEWTAEQIRFLSEHQYFTAAARSLRDPGKMYNIAELKRLLGQIS